MTSTAAAHAVIEHAVAAGVFPAATIEVGDSAGPMWADALGTMTFDVEVPVSIATPFDLASLTKVIATTTVIIELVHTGALGIAERVSTLFEEWRGTDRENVTVADLLEHASGLPARLIDQPPPTRREFEHDIATIRLEYAPRTRSVYSDLGFILLGFAATDRGAAPLDVLFDRVMKGFDPSAATPSAAGVTSHDDSAKSLTFALAPDLRQAAAPTRPMEIDPRRGRLLTGEVHDNYAAALGGVAGHAGLFGTASAVGAFARAMLRAARGDAAPGSPFAPDLVARFTARTAVPGSSRALGWDTMLPTSSCGSRMSPDAFGHVGFTGTSLWIDPVRDRYFVLLTNRVCGTGTLDDMRTVRRAFHDALGDM